MSGNYRHGMVYSPEYQTWQGMKKRCYNPKTVKYPSYGGRGITVCEQWKDSFETFFQDMGSRPSAQHSIERINNDGNYEPKNCRWALAKEQSRNTRRNQEITFNGKTQCISAWAEDLQLHHSTVASRLKNGWSLEKALTSGRRVNQYG